MTKLLKQQIGNQYKVASLFSVRKTQILAYIHSKTLFMDYI